MEPTRVRHASSLPALALALAALSLGACGDAPVAGPSIVLLSIDTLRSDRLPAYGYEKVETPGIDALRRDGILFERAYSHAPTTLASHASIFTGLLPPEHGVRGNSGYTLTSESLPYLPALLKERGYATAAAVSSFVMRRETGLATGFDLYEDDLGGRGGDRAGEGPWAERIERLQRRGPDTLAAVLPWLRSRTDGPFFLFVHLYEPHTPYRAPEPFASRYASGYDAEIAAADAVVSELVDELKATGRYDDSVVILTSDHGEGLGDHGEDGHGIFLYRESLQVPLILKLPGGDRAGESVRSPAQLVDLYPTVVDLVGGELGDDQPGRSLLRAGAKDTSRRAIYSETYHSRFFFGWSELASLIEGPLQYIDSPEPELYDLEADPGQRRNLVSERRDTARRLKGLLSQVDRKLKAPAETDLETWRNLAALGYLGHGRVRVGEQLPAPHSQVRVLRALESGLRQALDGDHSSAVTTLATVVAENPFALLAWEQMGRSFERLGRERDAHQAYLRALELTERAPYWVLTVARSSVRIGELDRARELAEEALSWNPVGAREVLARAAIANRDLSSAEAHIRSALATQPGSVAALFLLAQIQLHRSDLEAALRTATEAEAAADAPVRSLELLRANILAVAGRTEESEEALRREIELFPRDLPAYSRLATFLARQGRPQEAVAVVRQLVETREDASGYAAAVRTLEALGDRRGAEALLAVGSRQFPESVELADMREAALR